MELRDATRIGQGRTADVYAWGEGRALKLFQAGAPESWLEHERRNLAAALAAGLPAPALLGLEVVEGPARGRANPRRGRETARLGAAPHGWHHAVMTDSDPMTHGSTNALLGHPRDARLLVVNADDLGMYPGMNEGVARALAAGVVRSTSLMVPCPAAPEAMRWLAAHPEASFGVHLTLVCDLPGLSWGPISPPGDVPSLVNEAGRFQSLEQMPDWLPKARLEEVEREYRAQLAVVLGAGLQPSHLDWHCSRSGGRPDVYALTLALAREHDLGVRVADPALNAAAQARGFPAADHTLLDSFDLPLKGKAEHYARLLRELPPGLSAWAVHPGASDDLASRRVDPGGWAVRASDLAFFSSPEATEIVREEGIVLLGHRDLVEVWRRRWAAEGASPG